MHYALKYNLENYTLDKYDIIGTSNEFFCGNTAKISVEAGKLLVIVTNGSNL
jgi:thiamine pyrophosphokinase